MNKSDIPASNEMPAEFDFSRSIPNPWFVAVHGPEYVRVVDKDLAALFPDNASMNAALRSSAKGSPRVPRKVRARTADVPKQKKKIRS